MVEVVIRLPKDVYEMIISNTETIKANPLSFQTLNAVLDGTVLQRGHGRLIDADDMIKILRKLEYYQEKRGDFYGADVTSRVKNFIDDTETVIEADKEEK